MVNRLALSVVFNLSVVIKMNDAFIASKDNVYVNLNVIHAKNMGSKQHFEQ